MTFTPNPLIIVAMTIELSDSATIELHKRLVIAAVREVLGLQTIGRLPAEVVVNRYYENVAKAVRNQLVVAHDDPLDLAFDLAGDEAPIGDDELYRRKYEDVLMREVAIERQYQPGR